MSRASVPSVPPLDAEALIGLELVDRYRITELLATGGMGSVFVGVDERTGDEVAIKVMRGELAHSEEALARFYREVRAVVTLDSPHIVKAHDTGTVEAMPYLVMERLVGQGLDELQDSREITARRAIEIVLDILEGLAHAHAVGIIHRDLKPSNVWITDDDCVKILDFGVAKMHGTARMEGDETGKLTSSDAVLGSPAYMSPEQLVSSKEADERADLWSVGVLLYELLTGSMLFKAETVGGIFANVIRMRIPPLREVVPGASPELERILARCLERDPSQRFASAAALSGALRTLLEADARGDALLMAPQTVHEVGGVARLAVVVGDDTLGESTTIALPDATRRSPGRPAAHRWLGAVMVAAVVIVAVVAFVGTRASAPSSPSTARSTTRDALQSPSVITTAEVETAPIPSARPASSAEAEPSPSDSVVPRHAPTSAPRPVTPPAATAEVPPEDDLWETSRH